jgi:hypothetical protein
MLAGSLTLLVAFATPDVALADADRAGESAQPTAQPVAQPTAQPSASWQRRALSAGAAAIGAGTGVLLALPASVPGIYLAAFAGMSPFVGALPLLVAVPIAVALGSGVAVSTFSSGVGPYLVAGAAATVGGLATLIVGAVVAPARPQDDLSLHLGVLSLVGIPTLAAAGAAAAVAPFVTNPAAAGEAEVE